MQNSLQHPLSHNDCLSYDLFISSSCISSWDSTAVREVGQREILHFCLRIIIPGWRKPLVLAPEGRWWEMPVSECLRTVIHFLSGKNWIFPMFCQGSPFVACSSSPSSLAVRGQPVRAGVAKTDNRKTDGSLFKRKIRFLRWHLPEPGMGLSNEEYYQLGWISSWRNVVSWSLVSSGPHPALLSPART